MSLRPRSESGYGFPPTPWGGVATPPPSEPFAATGALLGAGSKPNTQKMAEQIDQIQREVDELKGTIEALKNQNAVQHERMAMLLDLLYVKGNRKGDVPLVQEAVLRELGVHAYFGLLRDTGTGELRGKQDAQKMDILKIKSRSYTDEIKNEGQQKMRWASVDERSS